MNILFGLDEIFKTMDNVYMLSTVTMLAAVILAFYFSNLVKDIGVMGHTQAEQTAGNEDMLLDGNVSEEIQQSSEEQLCDYSDDDNDEDFNIDNPVGDGLVGKLKSARIKELEAQLTDDQWEEERRIEREQLAAIFDLLKKQEAELNMKEINKRELVAQLNLYR